MSYVRCCADDRMNSSHRVATETPASLLKATVRQERLSVDRRPPMCMCLAACHLFSTFRFLVYGPTGQAETQTDEAA